MAITIEEFEQRLNDLLTRMEGWPRCEWCGCDDRQRRTAPNSKLCDGCKEWKRKEGRAEEWIRKNPSEEWKREHPDIARKEQYMRVEYEIEYAALCRQDGQICALKKYVEPFDLESELRLISERFCGERHIWSHDILLRAFQRSATETIDVSP